MFAVEKHLEKFLKSLVSLESVKFFKSLVKYHVEWPCKNSVIRARFSISSPNTSRYVYSVLSCLSSRCKPSLPV